MSNGQADHTPSNTARTTPLRPGATIGVVGGGQLGRYFVLAARQLGYHCCVLDPDANAPAMQLASVAIVGKYDDEIALTQLAQACDAVTIEFENVPAASLELLNNFTRVAPSARVVKVAQDRHLEKQTATEHGLQPVPYAEILQASDIDKALHAVNDTVAKRVSLPAILKSSRLGYDGKGQATCNTVDEAHTAFNALNGVPCVLEQRIDLQSEISVVMARGFDGKSLCFPVAQNVHVNGILHTSTVPATVDDALQSKACQLATQFADGLDYVGVLAVEFFVDQQGQLLFNEMAPRPHNSGHYTLDATATSQFEQQLRALCALPLGSVRLLSPVTMLNILGDSWTDGEPDWQGLFAQGEARLHLYGKSDARPGRKMGHVNFLASKSAQADFQL